MKRLPIIFLVALLISSTPVMAQYGIGSINMYTSSTATDDCDRETYIQGQEYDVFFWCHLDEGTLDGIHGFQFKVEVNTPPTVVASFFGDLSWVFASLAIGTLTDGIAVTTTGGCFGSGENTMYLGSVPFTIIGSGVVSLHLIPDPDEPGDVYIMSCETGYPFYKARGGWYVFGGTCDTDAKTDSWGAIKSIYSD